MVTEQPKSPELEEALRTLDSYINLEANNGEKLPPSNKAIAAGKNALLRLYEETGIVPFVSPDPLQWGVILDYDGEGIPLYDTMISIRSDGRMGLVLPDGNEPDPNRNLTLDEVCQYITDYIGLHQS